VNKLHTESDQRMLFPIAQAVNYTAQDYLDTCQNVM